MELNDVIKKEMALKSSEMLAKRGKERENIFFLIIF